MQTVCLETKMAEMVFAITLTFDFTSESKNFFMKGNYYV